MVDVVMVHGCPYSKETAGDPETRTYDKHWMPWTKKQLEEKGLTVATPLMPEPWNPDYDRFKGEFEKIEVGENTVLIGHSCGCAFLVRWLGETGRKVKKLILVAPWKIPNAERKKDFYEYTINSAVKDNVGEIVMFTADDEEEDGKKSLEMYNEVLDANVIELKGHGHYVLDAMGTSEFPELLEVING